MKTFVGNATVTVILNIIYNKGILILHKPYSVLWIIFEEDLNFNLLLRTYLPMQ